MRFVWKSRINICVDKLFDLVLVALTFFLSVAQVRPVLCGIEAQIEQLRWPNV